MTPFNTWIRGPPYIYPNFSGFCRRAKRRSETTEALTFEEYQVGLLRCCIWQSNIFQCKSKCVNQHDCLSMHTHIFDLYTPIEDANESVEFRIPGGDEESSILGPRGCPSNILYRLHQKKEPSCQMLTHAPKWAKKAASDFRCPKDHRNSTCSDPKLVKQTLVSHGVLGFCNSLCQDILRPRAPVVAWVREFWFDWRCLHLYLAIPPTFFFPFWDGEWVKQWPLQFGDLRDLQRLGMNWNLQPSLSQATNPPPGPDRQCIHPQLQEPGSYQSCWKLHYLDFSEMIPVGIEGSTANPKLI